MRKQLIKSLFWIGILFGLNACILPSGITIGPVEKDGKQYITLNLSKVSLKFDFGKKLNTAFIMDDYSEFITYHNVIYKEDYSGEVANLHSILWGEDGYDENHKP